ncbi:MAG: hypothetical protein LUQ31_08495 [Methanoregula sp.]|nr:hypothetical protein [Methanoregula sp.]
MNLQKSDTDPKTDLYTTLKREIRPVRAQGENPVRDPSSFSRCVCDLCTTSHPAQELRQCAICGRWACDTCWTKEYYLCNSCNGILRLHLLKKEP